MGRRATGSRAKMAAAFEAAYGTPETTGYYLMPFVSSALGEEQGLIASDLLGQGREPLPPSLDVANNDGDVVVPVDVRYWGFWLKLMFGAPTSTDTVAATGSIVFSAQPAANSTITLNGVTWTFKASGATGNETNIGANLNATLVQLRTDLNASVVAGLAVATYAGTAGTLLVTHDTIGAAGNAYTLVAGAGSNGTVSGETLSGGATKHTFVSGDDDLPSMDVEIAHPELDTPVYGMNFGARGNTMKVGLARSGLLNATLNLIAQGETIAATPADATPSELAIERFSQFKGEVKKDGAVLGSVVSAEWTYSNDLEKVEVIRNDGRIEDADPGTVAFTGNIVTRFKDTTLLDQATAQEPCEISFGHAISASKSLLVTAHSVYLPKAKRPITGPKGVQTTFAFQSAKDPTTGISVTVELTNDVASYA